MGFFDKLVSGAGGGSYAGREVVQEDFKGKNLQGANFQGAELTQCEFQRANLMGADFTGATLSQCDMSGANLRGAKLDRSDCTQTTFTHAAVEGMTTAGASFSQCEGLPASCYSKFDDIDDDDAKFAVAREKLQTLAAIAPGGQVVERRDDDKVFYSGNLGGRPFRVLVETTWGGVQLEMKIQNSRGRLLVHFDPDAAPDAAPVADSVWDKQDNTTQKFFLGPGVYLEDDAEDLAAMRGLLVADLPQMITHYLRGSDAKRVRLDDTDLELELRGDVLAGDLVARMGFCFDFVQRLCAQMGC